MVSEFFLEQVKRQSLSKLQVFVEVPPGANNIHREFPVGVTKGPEIHYIQVEGERTCLITSLASLLYFVNSREHASELFNSKGCIQEQTNVWEQLQIYLTQLSGLLKLQKIDYSHQNFKKINPEIPIITCLRASNGKEDHTVTIYKNWIFDGNFIQALALQKESLDICCSTNDESFLYESMLHTYIIPYFNQYLQKFVCADQKKKKYEKKKKKKNNQKRKKRRGTK